MTTINNDQSLIEKVGGIEKAREIIAGAPEWANGYNTVIQKYVRGVWFSRDFRLNDLRTAIAKHDNTDHVTDIRNHVKCKETFEQLPEIKDSLSENIVFVGNKYITANEGFYDLVNWLNGAWYTWQSRQAEVDQLNEVLDERTKEWLEAIELGTYFQDVAKPLKDEVDQLQSQINEMAEVGLIQESAIRGKDKKLKSVEQILIELKESMTNFKEMDLYDKGFRVVTDYIIRDLEEALLGHDQYKEHRTKAEQQINNGARLTKHQIDLGGNNANS